MKIHTESKATDCRPQLDIKKTYFSNVTKLKSYILKFMMRSLTSQDLLLKLN